jgi:hypothetical protein
MNSYTVTVKAVYMQEMTILADDMDAAEKLAIREFEPDGDSLFTIDVLGLSPWAPDSHLEDILHEQHRQRELDDD